MASTRGGLAGFYDRNKKIINPIAKTVSFAASKNPLGVYNTNLLTKEGGGLKATVNDPLWRAQAAVLAGGLAAGAMGAGAAAGKAGGLTKAAGTAAGNLVSGGGSGGAGSSAKWNALGQLGVAGIGAIGSGLSGAANAKQNAADLAERQRQFDLTDRWMRERLGLEQGLDRERLGQDYLLQQQQMTNARNTARENLGQSDRQFADRSGMDRAKFLDERGQSAIGVQNALNLAPMRDRALYMLQQRAGAMPAAFQARDFTRGGVAGSGQATGGYGSVLAAGQQAAGNYRGGMGGYDTTAMREALARYRDPSNLPDEYKAKLYELDAMPTRG